MLALAACTEKADGKLWSDDHRVDSEDYRKMTEESQTAFGRGDYDRVYELVLPYAEAGIAEAQFGIAFFVGSGYGPVNADLSVEERQAKAMVWLRRAVAQAYPKATDHLAVIYTDIEKNDTLAACWRTAANDLDQVQRCTDLEKELLPAPP